MKSTNDNLNKWYKILRKFDEFIDKNYPDEISLSANLFYVLDSIRDILDDKKTIMDSMEKEKDYKGK